MHILNEQIKEYIKKDALSNSNEEVCGLIFEDNGIIKCVKCKNINSEKNKFFTICPNDYLKVSIKYKIIGCYHSHKENEDFSNFDKLNAKKHNLIYLMYCLKSDSFREFFPNESILNEYLNLDFKIGEQDCFTLIEKYYNNELRFSFKKIFRDDNWYKKNNNLIIDILNEYINKFEKIDIEKIQKNDIIIFNYNDKKLKPHHLGIYLGNNEFLHHPRNKKSVIEIYDNLYKKKTFIVLRLKNEQK